VRVEAIIQTNVQSPEDGPLVPWTITSVRKVHLRISILTSTHENHIVNKLFHCVSFWSN